MAPSGCCGEDELTAMQACFRRACRSGGGGDEMERGGLGAAKLNRAAKRFMERAMAAMRALPRILDELDEPDEQERGRSRETIRGGLLQPSRGPWHGRGGGQGQVAQPPLVLPAPYRSGRFQGPGESDGGFFLFLFFKLPRRVCMSSHNRRVAFRVVDVVIATGGRETFNSPLYRLG
ncbi:hypothetical protein EJ04DRAFT_191577 [Polyplosphaeria fusca]|uniref:Uncharacterized protein n=1 Tax=Polyplosphaeria fusca TaxID=682080 RepID=A0A9P4V4U6_9PLEO|nr:hypothetical protein EJ04DRAFT_191577 [Polyplosphaeria fusca]